MEKAGEGGQPIRPKHLREAVRKEQEFFMFGSSPSLIKGS
jgi:hypothetical protein